MIDSGPCSTGNGSKRTKACWHKLRILWGQIGSAEVPKALVSKRRNASLSAQIGLLFLREYPCRNRGQTPLNVSAKTPQAVPGGMNQCAVSPKCKG
jgi:hypothetical protein